MSKIKVEVEILDGKYCRNEDQVCRFHWENEDGNVGCCLLYKSRFFHGEIDTGLVPKFDGCPNPYQK